MPCPSEFRSAFAAMAATGLLAAMLGGAFAQSSPSAPPPKPGPYKAIPITLPSPIADASFSKFREQLVAIAERRDRAALARVVVSKDFFWERQSGDGADKAKSGIDNLSKAIGLDSRDDQDIGWDTIAIYANDPTATEMVSRKGVLCGPADPSFAVADLEALLNATGTDLGEWVYPIEEGIELHATPSDTAPVVEKLGLMFLRLLPGDVPGDPGNATDEAGAGFIRLMSPSGKVGYAKADGVASLGVSQLCYVKDGGAWKIAGVVGDTEQQ